MDVRQVQLDSFEAATWSCVDQFLFFLAQDLRQIDLNPLEPGRQRQAVRPRIEAGGQVENTINCVVANSFQNDHIKDAGTYNNGPGIVDAPGERSRNPLATFTRSDGHGTQVTYNGLPLYTYTGDSKPGDAKGEGLQGVWFAVTPSMQATSTGTSSGGNNGGGNGYGGGYGNP